MTPATFAPIVVPNDPTCAAALEIVIDEIGPPAGQSIRFPDETASGLVQLPLFYEDDGVTIVLEQRPATNDCNVFTEPFVAVSVVEEPPSGDPSPTQQTPTVTEPSDDDQNCIDFDTQAEAQAAGDGDGLDGDGDGTACEANSGGSSPVDTPAPVETPDPVQAPDPVETPVSTLQPGDPGFVDRNCGDFATQAESQAFFEAAGPGDPHRLDGDGNGVACESLP